MQEILSTLKYVLKVNTSVNKETSDFLANFMFLCSQIWPFHSSKQFIGRVAFGILNMINVF